MEVKIVVLGSANVGKSAITIQYLHKYYVNSYNPTIEDHYNKEIIINKNKYILDVIDTVDYDEYFSIINKAINNGDGFIIVYDINDINSFNNIENIIYDIRFIKKTSSIPIVICGNKNDIEEFRGISSIDGIDIAKRLNYKFFECSAKNRINIEELWTYIINEVIKYKKLLKVHKKKKKKCLLM
jgi:GTPase KRas protein